jgi:hypothetical protein
MKNAHANELSNTHDEAKNLGYVTNEGHCTILRTNATFTDTPSRIKVPVQSPSCQTRRYQVQDEVDNQQRCGQAPSDSESHSCCKVKAVRIT